jgi:hypothetical protein
MQIVCNCSSDADQHERQNTKCGVLFSKPTRYSISVSLAVFNMP